MIIITSARLDVRGDLAVDLPAPTRARFPRRAYTTTRLGRVRSGYYIKYYAETACVYAHRPRIIVLFARALPRSCFVPFLSFPENRNSHNNERNANNTVRNARPRRTRTATNRTWNLLPVSSLALPPAPSVRHDSLCKNLLVPGRPRYVTRARKNGAADRGTTGSFGDVNKSRATDSRTDGCVPCTGSNR